MNDNVVPLDFFRSMHKKCMSVCKLCHGQWICFITFGTKTDSLQCPHCGGEKSKTSRMDNFIYSETNIKEFLNGKTP